MSSAADVQYIEETEILVLRFFVLFRA